MRTAILSLSFVSAFVLMSTTHLYAQPVQSPDDRVRTSTVAPDLHDTASGWNGSSD